VSDRRGESSTLELLDPFGMIAEFELHRPTSQTGDNQNTP